MIEQGSMGTVGIQQDFRVIQNEPSGEKVIRLIAPSDGAVTLPMQRCSWPGPVRDAPEDESRVENWRRDLFEDDQSLPRPVMFAWEPLTAEDGSLCYDLILATDAGLRKKVVVLQGLSDPYAEVYNLWVGRLYYWRVIARRKGNSRGLRRALAASKISYFFTNAAPPRWIQVPGITNVRDIGGWALPGKAHVRQGMIYRGSEMNGHCTIRAEGRDVLVKDLGIRTDLDLRGLGEERTPVLDLSQVEYVNIPVLAYDSIANPEYTGRYRALFNLLTRRSMYPIFVHCWGGADRTGTVVFLIQALLGMNEEDLFTDYELTSLSVWGERLRGSEAFQDLLQTLELFAVEGSSIQTQVERYLTVIGVTREEMERIREILIEEER